MRPMAETEQLERAAQIEVHFLAAVFVVVAATNATLAVAERVT